MIRPDCILYAVGKPVYNKFTPNMDYGAWLKDPMPRNDDHGEKIWFTNQSNAYYLYEYMNKNVYRTGAPKDIELTYPFRV